MLETGIGRAHNVALSTLANFRLPGDVSASKRYFRKDLIEPEVEVDPQGRIYVPPDAGIGFRPHLKRIERVTVRTRSLRPCYHVVRPWPGPMGSPGSLGEGTKKALNTLKTDISPKALQRDMMHHSSFPTALAPQIINGNRCGMT